MRDSNSTLQTAATFAESSLFATDSRGMNVRGLCDEVARRPIFRKAGNLRSALGVLEVRLPAAVGELCRIQINENQAIAAEVVGFTGDIAQVLPFENIDGLQPTCRVQRLHRRRRIPVGRGLVGRILNALGTPIDGRSRLGNSEWRSPIMRTPAALDRPPISDVFATGQRVIDGLLTCGRGQRVGLFAGSGVGKSTLLGEIARGADSDVNVVALIGERGREVRPFLEDCLGAEGLKRSVMVVATSDEPPLKRLRAAETAVAIADDFRQRGANVLLMMDSLTRLAHAQREIGLLLGEPPSARGYTPSVFQMMAGLLEQLGNTQQGSITGIITVLVDGDDTEEPVADAARGILDGHIVLDRKLAEGGHFPAVSVASSISRVMNQVVPPDHLAAALKVRAAMSSYEETRDLIRIGAYASGSSAEVDAAVQLHPAINMLLKQRPGESCSMEETHKALQLIAARWPG